MWTARTSRGLAPSEVVHYRGRSVGFVFQSYNLIPNLNSIENVMLPMEFIGVSKSERGERARQLLDQVELTGDKQGRKPGRLSGGEQQRVAIARALANKPSIVLADEPAGNLDSQTSCDDRPASPQPGSLRGNHGRGRHPRPITRRPSRQGAPARGRPPPGHERTWFGGIFRRSQRDDERFVSVVSRGIRNAFRNATRAIAIVVILGLSVGLSFVMLIGHKGVQNKIDDTLASIGNSVNIAPAGAAAGSTKHLTTAQLSKVAHLPYVVNLDEALPDSVQPNDKTNKSAGGGKALLPSNSGEPVSSVGTNEPTDPSNIGASTLTIVAGHVIDGAGDSDDAMVSAAIARKNHLRLGSTFTAYGSVFTVRAIFDSDTGSGNDTVIVPLATEQRLTHQDRDVASAVATADSLTHLSAVTGEITAALGPTADVTSDIAQADQALAPLNSVKSLSLYSLFGAVGAAAVITFLIMVMIVRERKLEVGILKAIGGSNGRILSQFMTEALTFSVLGGAAGLLAGALAASTITSSLVGNSAGSNSSTNGLTVRNPVLEHLSHVHATASVADILVGLAAILLIAASGSAAASYLISRIQPAEALRTE